MIFIKMDIDLLLESTIDQKENNLPIVVEIFEIDQLLEKTRDWSYY